MGRDVDSLASQCQAQLGSARSKSCFHGSLRNKMKQASQVYGRTPCRQDKKAWDSRVYQNPCHIFSQPDRQTQAKQHLCSNARINWQLCHNPGSHMVSQLHSDAMEEEIAVANLLQTVLSWSLFSHAACAVQDSSDCWTPFGWLQQGPRHALKAKSAPPAWHKKRPRTAAAASPTAAEPCCGLTVTTSANPTARSGSHGRVMSGGSAMIPASPAASTGHHGQHTSHSSSTLLHPSAPAAGGINGSTVPEQEESAHANSSQPLDGSSFRSAESHRPSSQSGSVEADRPNSPSERAEAARPSSCVSTADLLQQSHEDADVLRPSRGSLFKDADLMQQSHGPPFKDADLLQLIHDLPPKETAAAMAAWLVQQPDLLQSVLTQLEALAMEPDSQTPSPAQCSQLPGDCNDAAVIIDDQRGAAAATVQPQQTVNYSPCGNDRLCSFADRSEALQDTASAGANTVPTASANNQADAANLGASCGVANEQAAAAAAEGAAAVAVGQADAASPQAPCMEQVEANVQLPDLSQQLLQFSIAGRYGEAKALLKQDTLVDCTDTEGNTPLMLSCQEGHGRLVKLFVRKGADVRIRNADGLDAEQLALQMGHSHIARFLQEM